MVKIKFVSKTKLYPAFGSVNIRNNVVYIRNDLPEIVKKFVMYHELYHLKDKTKNWVYREIKANLYGAFKNPFGFILCLFMSFAPYRLKFYFQRFKKGE